MLPVGIDAINFYTSHYFLDLKNLALARGVDPNKYYTGLGQCKMSVSPPNEDSITLAANAVERLSQKHDLRDVALVLFATESGIDHSKAGGIYIHHLLQLPANCRVLELKQACYSATAAIQLGCSFIRQYPKKKVLVIASDMARYGLKTPGEPTQGCGAVAILLAVNPSMLLIEPESGVYTAHVMDFWRPNYRSEALVDGKYSTKIYLSSLEEAWKEYFDLSERNFEDHSYFCYHLPFTRMAQKAHERLAKYCGINAQDIDLNEHLESSLVYSRIIGNSYTASLYIGLMSLLENSKGDLSHKRIGMFSYGSGCVSEFFSGIIQPEYQKYLDRQYHQDLLMNRKELTCAEYEQFYSYLHPNDGGIHQIPQHDSGNFSLHSIENHQRIYRKKVG